MFLNYYGVTLLLNGFADCWLVNASDTIRGLNLLFDVFKENEGFDDCVCKNQFQDEKLSNQD